MHVFAWCVDLILNCTDTVNQHWGLSFSVFSHPTSCCSAAEIMSVLFFHTMRYKTEDPRNQCNDRFVLSKVKVNTWIIGFNFSVSLPEISPDSCFTLVGLGPRCTHPVCSLGRGRFCERVWSAQLAQDWLQPGGPPHTRQSRILCILAVLLPRGNEKGCKIMILFSRFFLF